MLVYSVAGFPPDPAPLCCLGAATTQHPVDVEYLQLWPNPAAVTGTNGANQVCTPPKGSLFILQYVQLVKKKSK